MLRIAMLRIAMVQTAVAALALLIFRDAFEQMHATEIRPERGCDINFGVGQLPEQKVAEPHFARGADHQVGIRQVPRVKMTSNRVFVNPQVLEAPVHRGRADHGAECVHQFTARAVVQGQREYGAGVI